MKKIIATLGLLLMAALPTYAQECVTKEQQLSILEEHIGDITIVEEEDNAVRYASPKRPESDLIIVYDEDGCSAMGLVVAKEPTLEV